ncbi:MAG: PIN domain-containing protein [Acidimicrobiia bacterium]
MSTRRPVAFLIDTSVWGRKHQAIVARRLLSLATADEMRTCRAVDLEVVYSVRSREVERDAWRRRLLLDVPITPDIMNRSLDVAIEMAAAGLHRHAKPMDLIIAAAAEAADLVVLHYDRDFDHIASVTDQSTEWVAPPGSLD